MKHSYPVRIEPFLYKFITSHHLNGVNFENEMDLKNDEKKLNSTPEIRLLTILNFRS
jgi:hypothetical protein